MIEPIQVLSDYTMVASYNHSKPGGDNDYFMVADVKDLRTGVQYVALWHLRATPEQMLGWPNPAERWLKLALYFTDPQAAVAYATQYQLWLGGDRDERPPVTEALSYGDLAKVKEVA